MIGVESSGREPLGGGGGGVWHNVKLDWPLCTVILITGYLTFSLFAWTDLNVNRGRDLILIKRIEQNIIYKVMGVRGVD